MSCINPRGTLILLLLVLIQQVINNTEVAIIDVLFLLFPIKNLLIMLNFQRAVLQIFLQIMGEFKLGLGLTREIKVILLRLSMPHVLLAYSHKQL